MLFITFSFDSIFCSVSFLTLYRSSSGCTATAESASIVSIRVVDTMIDSPPEIHQQIKVRGSCEQSLDRILLTIPPHWGGGGGG